MRTLILTTALLICCNQLHGQGTSIPVNAHVMTAITGTTGYSASPVGFDKCVYVNTRNITICVVNYRTSFSESQDAKSAYSYADNRNYLIEQEGTFHGTHTSGEGHNWGHMFHDTQQDAVFYIQNSGSNAPEMNTELWKWDVGAMLTSVWTTPTSAGALVRVWTDNNTIFKGMAYDPVNHLLVVFPNYQSGTGQASICNMITSSCVTSSTANGPSGTLDEPAMVADTINGLIWVWDGSTIRSLNTSTGVWTNPTPSCTGTNCVSGHPQARKYNAMALSPVDHKILMIGGVNGSNAYTDIWTIDIANPAAPAYNEECATGTGCGYIASTASPTTSFNRMIYDSVDNVFLFTPENGSAWLAYALSTALNYGRNTPTYAPPAGSINRTAPPSSPTSAASSAYAFHVHAAVSGSDLLVTHIETPPASITGNCAGPTPTVYTTAGGGAHIPPGSVATQCTSITGQNLGTYPTSHPLVADVGGTKWLAFERHGFGGQSNNSAAFAGPWTGSVWDAAGTGCFTLSCSQVTQYPAAFLGAGSVPTIAVIEQNNQVSYRVDNLWVAQWNSGTSTWVSLGSTRLNRLTGVPQAYSAALAATASNNVGAAWAEMTGSDHITITTSPQIFVSVWDGSTWNPLGGSLNQSASSFAYTPSIANVGGVWYVAWTERTQTGISNLFVKYWSGGVWNLAGSGSLNITTSTGQAYHPTLATDGTNVWVAWEEQSASGQHALGYVKKWNTSTWSAVGSSIAMDPSNGSVNDITINLLAGAPTVAFLEQSYGNMQQAYVQQFNGSSWGPIPGAPAAAVGSAISSKSAISTTTRH